MYYFVPSYISDLIKKRKILTYLLYQNAPYYAPPGTLIKLP